MLCCLLAPLLWAQDVNFDQFFTGKTLRIDFYISGHAKTQTVVFDRLLAEGPWPGSPLRLIDTAHRGAFRTEIIDPASGRLIFASEMVSVFSEYAITPPALAGEVRALHHSVRLPMPRNRVRWILKCRTPENLWTVCHAQILDPASPDLHRDPLPADVRIVEQQITGAPSEKVDLVFLGEGYTAGESNKFDGDLQRFTEVLFSVEPFQSHRDCFNIRGVFKASEESGIDDPARGRFVRTVLNATYRTLGMDHYLGTEANRAVRNLAAAAPYDVVLIMVNDPGFGGNGIYNWFTMFTTGSRAADVVFLHELGHGFGGLADEYYGDVSSALTASEIYRPGVEPYEPNITRLLDPEVVKWQWAVTPGIAIPTPWGQKRLDSLDAVLYATGRVARAVLDSLRQGGASTEVIELARQRWTARRRDAFRLAQVERKMWMQRLQGEVGGFEGAAHMPKGVYRPAMECLMNHMIERSFCPVCRQAFLDRILFYAPAARGAENQ